MNIVPVVCLKLPDGAVYINVQPAAYGMQEAMAMVESLAAALAKIAKEQLVAAPAALVRLDGGKPS